jgi:hypothetical protein
MRKTICKKIVFLFFVDEVLYGDWLNDAGQMAKTALDGSLIALSRPLLVFLLAYSAS